MTLEDYFKDNNFSIYRSEDDDTKFYEGNSEQFEKYLYKHEEFVKHIDEYDEDLYNESLICIYKYYYPKEHYFYYIISIYKSCPGLDKGNIEFKQKLDYNKELSVDYIKSLRNLFNI